MIVVSDTTPLIALMKASQLELLQKLFGKILIPKAVYDELTSNATFQDEANTVKSCPFLEVVTIPDSKTVDILRRATGLDLGESEAIVYAETNSADILNNSTQDLLPLYGRGSCFTKPLHFERILI